MSTSSRAKTLLKAFIKEPLVHFLVLGGLLFFISTRFDESFSNNDPQTINITTEQINQIQNKISGLYKRELTPAELQEAIDEYVEEEVLLREGLKLGVVDEDPAIRKNVAEKVEFLLSDTTLISEPTDAVLADYFKKHVELFALPKRRSFIHIYFDPIKHIDTLDKDIKKVQSTIASKSNINPLEFGDSFIDGNEYQQMGQSTITKIFGHEFATAVFLAPLNKWQGPIKSARGVHLLLVSEEIPAEQPHFNEVREQVKKLYIDEQHEIQNEAAVDQLKQQYQIIIEKPTTKK